MSDGLIVTTYRGDPAFKVAFLAELDKHAALDAFTKGTYGHMDGHFKGCGVGCSLASLNAIAGGPILERTSQHDRYPAELGWPLWLAYLEDNLFENLPDELSKTWPRRLAEAIPVGVTVPDLVLAKLLRWTLLDARFGVVHAADDESVKAVVRTMGALFERTIAGETVPEAEWSEAASAAWAAWAAWAARAAMDAWAASAARAASAIRAIRAAKDAWAARDASAASAIRAARAARAASDAWDAETRDSFYPALSEEIMRLLKELPRAGIRRWHVSRSGGSISRSRCR